LHGVDRRNHTTTGKLVEVSAFVQYNSQSCLLPSFLKGFWRLNAFESTYVQGQLLLPLGDEAQMVIVESAVVTSLLLLLLLLLLFLLLLLLLLFVKTLLKCFDHKAWSTLLHIWSFINVTSILRWMSICNYGLPS